MVKRVIAVLLAVLMMGSILAGCNGDGDKSTTSTPGGDTSISGEITYAVYEGSEVDAQAVIDEFNKVYPNIKVTIRTFPSDPGLTDYLSTQASTGNLPDVAYGWDEMAYFAQEGWLYPLDEFLDADDETQYIHGPSLEKYTIADRTYAVPVWLQFSCMVLNLDMIDELNEDVPAYNWTYDEFERLVRKATSSTTSGINHVHAIEEYLLSVFEDRSMHQYSYNPETHQFNLATGAWQKAIEAQEELKSISGLVSDDLKNDLLPEGEMDDYDKKFGKDADALREGKVLVGLHGTPDIAWVKTLPYSWDYYPIPCETEDQYRNLVHSDYAFMTSTCKNPEAAYVFLKWISFGKDGLLSRLDVYGAKVDDNGEPNPEFPIPASSHPDVVAKFNSLDYVPGGIKYMYENMGDNDAVQDYYKVLPDFWNTLTPVIEEARFRIENGESPSALAQEVTDLINSQYTTIYNEFISKMQTVASEFDAKKSAS